MCPDFWHGESEKCLLAKKIYGNASPKLITISRLDGRKSHHNVIMTVKNLLPKYPSLKYVSIGDGDEGNNLLKLRKTLGLEKNVEFIFNSTEQEKAALLEQSNIFVMPSVIYKKSVEGFGIVFIEAAQHGIPSIGGRDGGASDAIIHEKTGLICDGNKLEDVVLNLIKSGITTKDIGGEKSTEEFTKEITSRL